MEIFNRISFEKVINMKEIDRITTEKFNIRSKHTLNDINTYKYLSLNEL